MIHLIKYMHLYQDCDGLLKRLINCIKIVTYINYKNISERGCYLFSWEAPSRNISNQNLNTQNSI